MKRILFILFISNIFFFTISAQISEGGMPPSFHFENTLRSASLKEHLVPVSFDVERLHWEDSISVKNGSPFRIAKAIPVHIDIDSMGVWQTLPDSTEIWQESIKIPKAFGLIISYKDFYIPKGGKLFIYNKDKSQVLGAYTHQTNLKGGEFATEAIGGDSFTLEYVASNKSKERPRLAIDNVGYIYNSDFLRYYPKPPLNSSERCMINVNCEVGRNWQYQKRGVVLYLIPKSGEWFGCSGSLINNTNQDAIPYVLSAQHCISDGEIDFKRFIIYFDYEFPTCANERIAPASKSLIGVTPLAVIPLWGAGDSFLFKLDQNIPLEWNPYFNGWDRSNNRPSYGAVIHHPRSDVKKITLYKDSTASSTFVSGGELGARDGYWQVVYDGNSVTEEGSSGSPLFNSKGLIVGTLTGGFSRCYNLLGSDYYGKLWYNWDQFTNSGQADLKYPFQLKNFLDPKNSGVISLKGYAPNGNSGIEDEVESLEPKDLVIFPNPVESELNINSKYIIRSIKIFDLNGKLLYTSSSNNASTLRVLMSDWKKGIYIVSVNTDENQITAKFVKN